MSAMEQQQPPEPGSGGRAAPLRRVGTALGELWHQKPGPRPATASPAPTTGRTDKQIVDGLDRLELRLAIVATALQAVLTPIFSWYFHTHGSAAIRKGAMEFLITGIITTLVLAAGTVFKRRALVGFASFMTGMAWLTYGGLYFAVLFLFFGGWLIMRVMRKQKQDRSAGNGPAGRSSKAAGGASRSAPAASKRYTPPQRSTVKGRAAAKSRQGASSRASSGRRATQGRR